MLASTLEIAPLNARIEAVAESQKSRGKQVAAEAGRQSRHETLVGQAHDQAKHQERLPADMAELKALNGAIGATGAGDSDGARGGHPSRRTFETRRP